MTRKEFKNELYRLIYFADNGISKVEDKRLESALGKTKRHADAKGVDAWDEEELGNAVCFYMEYKERDTFNREVAKDRRRQKA